MVMLQFRQLVVQPGQRIQLQGIDWAEFEAIVDELGDRRSSRVAYSQGVLELRKPSCYEEKLKSLIGDCAKVLLEELDIEHECFGSSTFKSQNAAVGIEPDQCFYVANAALMIGKRHLDLTIDPPPDLAIEVDITSKTGVDAYQALGVPELWRFEDGRLRISLLKSGIYQDAEFSAHFPQFDVAGLIEAVIARSQTEIRSQTLKACRQEVRGLITSMN
jgi:Uma2 family endonuclease